MHCLSFSEYVDFEEREHYYSMLQLIFRRGELDLGQLGLQSVNSDQSTLDVKRIREKSKVAALY